MGLLVVAGSGSRQSHPHVDITPHINTPDLHSLVHFHVAPPTPSWKSNNSFYLWYTKIQTSCRSPGNFPSNRYQHWTHRRSDVLIDAQQAALNLKPQLHFSHFGALSGLHPQCSLDRFIRYLTQKTAEHKHEWSAWLVHCVARLLMRGNISSDSR